MREQTLLPTQRGQRAEGLSLIDPPIAAVTLRFPVRDKDSATKLFQGRRANRNLNSFVYNALPRVKWGDCGSPILTQCLYSDVSTVVEDLENKGGFVLAHAYLAWRQEKYTVGFSFRRVGPSRTLREKERLFLEKEPRQLLIDTLTTRVWCFEVFKSVAVGERRYLGYMLNFRESRPQRDSLRRLGEVHVESERIVIH